MSGDSFNIRWLEAKTHDLDQTGLAGDGLGTPSKVTSVETESAVLGVTTTDTDSVHTLGRVELGHGGLTAELELSLFTAGVVSRVQPMFACPAQRV